MENPNSETQHRKRVLLFPSPLEGHKTPMLHLANALHSKGFSITIIHTFFNAPHPSSFPNFSFHFFLDGLPPASRNAIDITISLSTNCEAPFKLCLSNILTAVEEKERVGCLLIADQVWAFVNGVAKEFGIPWLVLRTGSVAALTVYDALPVLVDKGYFPTQESRLEESVLDFPPLKIKDLPEEAAHGFLSGAIKQIKACQGVICNTFEELESTQLSTFCANFHGIPVFPIGPIHKHATPSSASINDSSIMSWLDAQAPKSVIFVSFGSVAAISKGEFLEVAWGLAYCGLPFLWVVRQGLIKGSLTSEQDFEFDQLTESFWEMVAGRGKVVRWARQLEVLAHRAIGGFWTHCGWNSTMEGISEGLPMICSPFIVDQSINARYIAEVWKVG